MRSSNSNRDRQPRRRGFDDDNFLFGNAPSPAPLPSFATASTAPASRATVKWYNPDKGFGFVEMSDGTGDAFLHANALQASGFQQVSPGAVLQVRVGQGQKGRQVEQVISVDESAAEAPRPRGPRPQSGHSRDVDLSAAVEVQGTVKWYNPDKGFGFVAPASGGKDVFVHASALQRSGLQTLAEGQSVWLKVIEGAKGLEAGAITLA